MQIAFTVKNTARGLKPNKDDVLIYDGQVWYITTKKELFKEYDEHFKQKLAECDQKKIECDQKMAELENYKRQLAEQMNQYSSLIREVIEKETK